VSSDNAGASRLVLVSMSKKETKVITIEKPFWANPMKLGLYLYNTGGVFFQKGGIVSIGVSGYRSGEIAYSDSF
jgi:hypothetical protein